MSIAPEQLAMLQRELPRFCFAERFDRSFGYANRDNYNDRQNVDVVMFLHREEYYN